MSLLPSAINTAKTPRLSGLKNTLLKRRAASVGSVIRSINARACVLPGRKFPKIRVTSVSKCKPDTE